MNELIARYMRACIRAHRPIDMERWTAQELTDTFAQIPPPVRDLPTWSAYLGESGEPSSEPETPLTDEQRERNLSFIEAVQKQKKETLDSANA